MYGARNRLVLDAFNYALYVILSAYARDFMSTKVVGNINVALVFGLLQFVSTFLIAWAYERFARRRLDPLSEQIRASVHAGGSVAPRQSGGESA